MSGRPKRVTPPPDFSNWMEWCDAHKSDIDELYRARLTRRQIANRLGVPFTTLSIWMPANLQPLPSWSETFEARRGEIEQRLRNGEGIKTIARDFGCVSGTLKRWMEKGPATLQVVSARDETSHLREREHHVDGFWCRPLAPPFDAEEFAVE